VEAAVPYDVERQQLPLVWCVGRQAVLSVQAAHAAMVLMDLCVCGGAGMMHQSMGEE
jgi:hypothetical protein